MEQKKPWYKSKIFLLASILAVVFGTDAYFHFISGAGVTPEQIEIVYSTKPEIADAIKDLQDGRPWYSVIGVVGSVAVAIFRKWFTSESI